MRKVSVAMLFFSLFLFLGCNMGSMFSNWPPDSPADDPIPGFEASSELSFNDWTHVFESAEDAGFSGTTGQEIESSGTAIGMAYLVKEGNFELPFNLFMIERPGETYVDCQFEVLYFDKNLTQIRAVESAGDKVALVDEGMSVESGLKISHSFGNPGAKARCGNDVYLLAKDGWYLNGELVHAFKD